VMERPKRDCWGRCDYPSECRWGRKTQMQVPARVSEGLSFEDVPVDDVVLAGAELDVTTSDAEIVGGEQKCGSHGDSGCDVLHQVVACATDRKRKSELLTLSPLTANPPGVPMSGPGCWDKIAARVSKHEPASGAVDQTDVEMTTPPAPPLSSLGKVIEDFEVEVRKSMERANDMLLAAVGWRARSPSPGPEDKLKIKEKDNVVEGVRGRSREGRRS